MIKIKKKVLKTFKFLSGISKYLKSYEDNKAEVNFVSIQHIENVNPSLFSDYGETFFSEEEFSG